MLNRLHWLGGHDSRLQHVYVAVNSGREAYTYYTHFTLCTLTSGMEAVEKGPSRPGLYRAWFSLPSLPTTARNKVCKLDSQACVFGNRIIFGFARTSFLLTDQIFCFFYSPFLDRFFLTTTIVYLFFLFFTSPWWTKYVSFPNISLQATSISQKKAILRWTNRQLGIHKCTRPSKIEVLPLTFGLSKSVLPIEIPFGSSET